MERRRRSCADVGGGFPRVGSLLYHLGVFLDFIRLWLPSLRRGGAGGEGFPLAHPLPLTPSPPGRGNQNQTPLERMRRWGASVSRERAPQAEALRLILSPASPHTGKRLCSPWD